MRGMKKKLICVLLVCCMAFGLLTGCGEKAEDNILTMMIPTELRAEDCEQFINDLREKFPEINFEVEFMDCDNTARYQMQRLRHDDATDIVWYSGVMDQEVASSKLVDLSGYSFMEKFNGSILSLYDMDGKIYQIPGPIAAQSIVVNKTLLSELGLEVPGNFDELVTAVKKIHEAYPEMNPLSIGMEKLTATMRYMVALNECGFLSEPAGAAWKKAYLNGEVSAEDGFSEGLDMMGRLIDAGAFKPEEDAKIGDMLADTLLHRETAMSTNMIVPRQATWTFQPSEDFEMTYHDEFVMIPFYGMEGQTGLGLLSHSAWGINKRLEEKENKQKLDNALKVMEYLSTTEAQMGLCPNETYIPALRTIEKDTRPDYLKKLWEKGEGQVEFFNDTNEYDDIEEDCVNIVWKAMKAGSSKGMKEDFIKTADRVHQKAVLKKDSIGEIQKTLLPEETMELYRKAILEKSGADFVMTTTTGYKDSTRNPHGLCPVKLYQGEVNRLLLGTGVGYWLETVQTISLTGAEVKTLLTDGKQPGGGENAFLGENIPFAYSATGLEITRDKNEKPTEVKWNGKKLEDKEKYTVAFLSNDYSEEIAKKHSIKDTGVSVVDAVADYIAVQSPIHEIK